MNCIHIVFYSLTWEPSKEYFSSNDHAQGNPDYNVNLSNDIISHGLSLTSDAAMSRVGSPDEEAAPSHPLQVVLAVIIIPLIPSKIIRIAIKITIFEILSRENIQSRPQTGSV